MAYRARRRSRGMKRSGNERFAGLTRSTGRSQRVDLSDFSRTRRPSRRWRKRD